MPKFEKSQCLEKSIFATIAYYDYFSYPLTAVEVYYYLINFETKDQRSKTKNTNQNAKPEFLEIIEILDSSETLKKNIDQKNGFYFLCGREAIIAQRIQKKKLTDEKFKKIKWAFRFVSRLPFIRLIMLSGSMGLGNPLKESDIDLLVIAKHGRIWTARAFLTFFMLLFGVYRHTGKTQNRLCLNHYITDRSLAIDFGNLYKAEEYLNLLPLVGDLSLYENFFQANGWMKDYVYSEGMLKKDLRFLEPFVIGARLKNLIETFLSGTVGNALERNLKKIQIYFIKKNPLTRNPYARIRYNDDNLVFHPVLVEPEVIEKWEEKIAKFTA